MGNDINTNSSLRRRVMLRIYVEYWKSSILAHREYVLPTVFFLFLLSLLSIGDIISNLSHVQPGSLFNFALLAAKNTELSVQIIFGTLFISLAVPIARRAFSISVSKSAP